MKEVDFIMAEWVGHGLFIKNKLPFLFHAREKWLGVRHHKVLSK